MKYISGIHALNLRCNLDTCGDWHCSALQWDNVPLRETKGSLWGDYGVEFDKKIPNSTGLYNTANHIRAILDILYDGNFSVAEGMRNNYICNDKYTNEIFEKVYMMKNILSWNKVDEFMGKEYFAKWLNFKEMKKNAEK